MRDFKSRHAATANAPIQTPSFPSSTPTWSRSRARRAATTVSTVKIAVVGAGAMGSVYAGILGDAGNEVWAIDVWAEHVEAIRARPDGRGRERQTHRSHRGDVGPRRGSVCDLVVIATKAHDVEAAARAAKPLLGPETVVLPIQNGLGSAERVAAVLGEEKVAIGVVGGFGASVVGPGHVHHNGWELVRLGERHGPVTPRIRRIARTWEDAGFRVQAYDDVDQLVWEKLVCNVCFSGTCTILERTIREVLDDPPPGTSPRAAPPRPTRSRAPGGSGSTSTTLSRTPARSARRFPTRGRRCCSTSWRDAAARSTSSTARSRPPRESSA